MTKMIGSSSDDGLGGTNIAVFEGISPSPLKAIESSNIVFILAAIFLCAYFLRIYFRKLLSSYHLKQHPDHRITKVSSSADHGLGGCKYDVFISFRGTDTREKFVSHLYAALCRKKIEAYKDDINLLKGDEISPSLREAIKSSKISIVVLSENYATSGWCLDELVHILKCKCERDQIVLPVFYGVTPSDVRYQKLESYASAFVKHEQRFKDDMEKVHKWRSALKEIGNLSGWDSNNKNGSEFELVEEIAQVILLKLYNLPSSSYDEINRNLVGMEERLEKIESLLCVDSPEVRVIGIWGMGGIGKSTLAEVAQNRFSRSFDSFYIDVSNALKHCELRDVNEKLFASLLKDKDVVMTSSFKFDRLQRSKVFLVLDNIGDFEQLEHLIGSPDQTKTRFGKGSRIIITSRDKKLLMDSADDIYEVDALELDEATQLFYQSAFRRDSSRIMEYTELSKKFVSYAGGNPLALKVLGSHLHSRSVKEWESALSILRKSPDEKIQNVLKISYDALDPVKQSIFLDIACFLKGEDRDFIEDILEDYSHISINILIERSLITTNWRGKIWMHDLIQEMAWEVVRQESVELGKRSRLWDAQDVCSVLKRNKGSASVKGMCLDLSKISNDLCLRSTVFEALENLIFLKIYTSNNSQKKFVYFNQGLDYLPDSLRYLHWEWYPLKSLPLTQNLVKLEMRNSKLEKLWDGVQLLENLKHIDLSWSRDLIELPDLSQAPSLESVALHWCERLCRFPKISRNLQYLGMVAVGITSLPMLPRNVRKLDLQDCKALFVSAWPVLLGLHSLTKLTMHGCDISDIPKSFNRLSSLETLDMGRNDFKRIPSSIKEMHKLKCLSIIECENLESLPDLPSSLESLEAQGCESLRMISVCGLASLKTLDASDCKSLEEFVIDEHGCTSLEEFDIDETSLEDFGIDEMSPEEFEIDARLKLKTISFSFENCLKLKQGSQDNICTLFQRQMLGIQTAFPLERLRLGFSCECNQAYYCGNEIPKWLTYCESEGSSIHVSLGHNVIGISVSVVLELEGPELLVSHYSEPYLRIWSGAIKLMDCSLPPVSFHSIRERWRPHVYMWHFYFDKAEKKLLDSVTEASFEFKLTDDNNVEKELLDSVTEASFELKLTDGNGRHSFKIKRMGIRLIYLEEVEEHGTDANTGATTSSPADAEEASSIGEPHLPDPKPDYSNLFNPRF